MSPPRSIMDGVTLVNVSKVQRPTPDQWPKSELTGDPAAFGTNDLINRVVAEWLRRIEAAV